MAVNGTGGPARAPVRFVFGVHLHQPVGNFASVFESHARDVYHPLLDALERRRPGPVLMHVSGPLVEWMQRHDHPLVDRIGRLVADGAVELLLGGMYEPILAAISRPDRADQIARHRDALRSLFGAAGHGLWLAERVWEPELPADLADAGVRYVLLDDRHFLASGFAREELRVPWRTEHEGKAVSVLAIDQQLRYLIPFRPPAELAAYVGAVKEAGGRLVVFADDGEKFGGWPGTRDWVYARGWFEAFFDAVDAMREAGVAEFSSGADALDTVPAQGPAYLPTASYEEMEQWTLPPDGARRLTALRAELGPVRTAGPDGPLVRGGHWRNYLRRYPEANRLHKKTLVLSDLCRARRDPPDARQHIARAQCNDALWHGVFGGLYLPFLRAALWRELAAAESLLRADEPLGADLLDLDVDGADEVWVHSAHFSAIVAPVRGGALIEWTDFAAAVNYADVLTRRREAWHYHPPGPGGAPPAEGGVPSIHHMEATLGPDALPPVDHDDRAIGVARMIARSVTPADYAEARYAPLASWARARCITAVRSTDTGVQVVCHAHAYTVEWMFDAGGPRSVRWRWLVAEAPPDAWFAPELSLARRLPFEAAEAVGVWRHPIETVMKSERAIERVVQGEAVTPLFEANAGSATIVWR